MPARSGSLLVGLLFVTTVLAGCHGLDDSGTGGTDPTPTGSPDPTGSPSPTPSESPDPDPDPDPQPDIKLEIAIAPDSITVGDTIRIVINVSGDAVEAETAELAFSNQTTVNIDPLSTDNFTGTRDGDGNVTFPGNYSIEDWTIDDNETVYMRAHIVVDGNDYWSDEHILAVNDPDAEPPTTKLWQILIGGAVFNTQSPTDPSTVNRGHCGTAQFWSDDIEDGTLTIKVGDAVEWFNNEAAGPGSTFDDCNTHVMASTSVPEGAESFNTETIARGESTTPIQFLVPGTYTYECTAHETMEEGTIVVEE